MTRPAAGTQTAPIYADTTALCQYVLGRLGDDPRALPLALCRTAIDLHGAVVLALGGRQRPQRLESADELLVLLRAQLRLAASVGLFDDSQLVHALERADTVGRQLGGWRRALSQERGPA